MVAGLAILLAFGAVQVEVSAAETQKRDPLIFAAPEGWRARLMYVVSPARAQELVDGKTELLNWMSDPQRRMKYADERAWTETIHKFAELVVGDPGSYLACDFKLEGRTFEADRFTQAVLYMADGRTVRSTVIVALKDPLEREMLSTGVNRFVVSDRLAGANEGSVRLYLRFSDPVELAKVRRWRMTGYR